MSQVNASGSNGFSLPEQPRATFADPAIAPQASSAQSSQARFPAGAQVARQDKAMLEELETTRRLLQFQQSLIESLTRKLGSSQARIDQLENDLTLAQQHHTDQSYLLQETETACLDLRTRLFRQQHQTFQFKAALEKCLESSKLQPLGQDDASGSSAVGELRSPLHSPSVSAPADRSGDLDPHSTLSRGGSVENSLLGSHANLGSLKAIQGPEPQPSASVQRATEMAVLAKEVLSVSTHERSFHLPLVFREQAIQPWSTASGATHATTVPHPPVIESISMPQGTLAQPDHLTGSTHSVPPAPKPPLGNPSEDFLEQPHSAPVLSKTSTPRVSLPSPCRSKRKSLADVQLPCFPRRP